MQIVILAGGMGTRLRAVTGEDLPKPLVKVNGRPLLDYQLAQVAEAGFKNVLLLTGYAGDKIAAYCGDGSQWGLSLSFVRETVAAGTAGAVLQAFDALEPRFLVLYGDTVFDFDMRRMAAFHERHAPDVTLFVHPNDHPHDSDLLEVDSDNRVLRFHPYPHPADANLPNLVNAGVYIFERSALLGLEGLQPKPDFGKHVFPLLLERGGHLVGYRSPEYIKDAGTPERLKKTGQDLISGRVAGCSLRHAAPAVLLDRDGTLIEECGYVTRPEQVALLPGVGSALALLNRSIYRTVLVTNQPVVARGDCDEACLQQIHNRMETLLGAEGAYIDALYFCPHHPDAGFAGERTELKIHCDCRKPKTGMIEKAQRDLNLNLADSWMIGDTTTDMMTAQQAGVRSVLVHTGEAGRDGKWPCLPDFECPSLLAAVDLIVRRWPALRQGAMEQVETLSAGDVVLIGGFARSGKSTLAATLASVLKEQGRPAVVIQLDCWLRGEDEDRGSSVVDRFDLKAARAFIDEARIAPGAKRIPRYDRLRRHSIPQGTEVLVPAHAVLIVEGVVALADAELRQLAARTIYVERPEEDRLREMTENYRWRGWDDERIAALLVERGADELPRIAATMQYADFLWRDSRYDRQ